MVPVALSIAGSDPGGGAGIQADLKTFHAHGVYGLTVPTLITVQNTLGVQEVFHLPAPLVERQIRALLDDFEVHAVKIGALGNHETVEVVADALLGLDVPVVLDPVVVSSSGQALLDVDALDLLKSRLFPMCTLVTPNLPELQVLFAGQIPHQGAFLVKGGHGTEEILMDQFWIEGDLVCTLQAPRQHTRNLHGTGCTLSSSITAHLAKGNPLVGSVQQAHAYLQGAIRHAPELGHGVGGLEHFWMQKMH